MDDFDVERYRNTMLKLFETFKDVKWLLEEQGENRATLIGMMQAMIEGLDAIEDGKTVTVKVTVGDYVERFVVEKGNVSGVYLKLREMYLSDPNRPFVCEVESGSR